MSRTFTTADQQAFAQLSGDWNPVHIDPLAARRSLFGGIVVHGVHLLLWALDELAAARELRSLSKLRARFERGLVIGEPVSAEWQTDGVRARCKLTSATGSVARISLTPSNSGSDCWAGLEQIRRDPCEEHAISDLAGKRGEIALALPASWKIMFPALSRGFSPSQVAVMLATTRLVGMVSPGLHSIFASLDLGCNLSAPAGGNLEYEVKVIDTRVQLVEMEVWTNGLHGTVGAFVRPKPYRQPSIKELRDAVEPGEFAGTRAIVIGGSRGLGELTAKLLAVGGASVTLTWCQGEAEAQAIVQEAAAVGRDVKTFAFDTAAPPPHEPPPANPYTDLYYFATPRIRSGEPGKFNPGIFAAFVDAYVTGFARSVYWFIPRAISNAGVWYPSTAFLDHPDDPFAEYTAAKFCGEALCDQMSKQLLPLRVFADRLPPLHTDQTQTLTPVQTHDNVTIVLEILRRHRGLNSVQP